METNVTILSLMACATLGFRGAAEPILPKPLAPSPMAELQKLLSTPSDARTNKAFVADLMVFQGNPVQFLKEHGASLLSTQPMDQGVRRHFGLSLLYVAPETIYGLHKQENLGSELRPVLVLNTGKINRPDLKDNRFSRPLYDHLATQSERQQSVEHHRKDLRFNEELLVVTEQQIPQ